MKVLVIASELISAERLRAALGAEIDDTEIMVVAPAFQSFGAALLALRRRRGDPTRRAGAARDG